MAPSTVLVFFLALVAQTLALKMESLYYPTLTKHAAASTAQTKHAYFRPSGASVSGFPGNNATYHRSPCPGLNTLANHGYLPRDGKAITPALIRGALATVYNLDPALAVTLTKPLADNFTLADLGRHNVLEHDASLVHNDAFFGSDPAFINRTLVDALLSLATGQPKVITKTALARFRTTRQSDSVAHNPEFNLTASASATAFSEAAILLLAMGDYATETITVDHARSFLLKERLPSKYVHSAMAITAAVALNVTAEMVAIANSTAA